MLFCKLSRDLARDGSTDSHTQNQTQKKHVDSALRICAPSQWSIYAGEHLLKLKVFPNDKNDFLRRNIFFRNKNDFLGYVCTLRSDRIYLHVTQLEIYGGHT